MKRPDIRSVVDSLSWNVFLLLVGAFLYVLGYVGVARHHDFVPGGVYGFSVLLKGIFPFFSLGAWFFLLNIPLFIFALKGVGKRFFLLNLFAMIATSLMTSLLQVDFAIQNEIYAAIVAGALMGAGCGVILRTYGGAGGMDVLAVILNRKYGVRVGVFYFFSNASVMLLALSRFPPDKVIASLIMIFISSNMTEYVLSLFNQRKMVHIITRKGQDVVSHLTEKRKLHATVIPAKGGYSGAKVDIVYSITDPLRLRALEQVVFEVDPDAIFVVENTFSVIGGGFARRKKY